MSIAAVAPSVFNDSSFSSTLLSFSNSKRDVRDELISTIDSSLTDGGISSYALNNQKKYTRGLSKSSATPYEMLKISNNLADDKTKNDIIRAHLMNLSELAINWSPIEKKKMYDINSMMEKLLIKGGKTIDELSLILYSQLEKAGGNLSAQKENVKSSLDTYSAAKTTADMISKIVGDELMKIKQQNMDISTQHMQRIEELMVSSVATSRTLDLSKEDTIVRDILTPYLNNDGGSGSKIQQMYFREALRDYSNILATYKDEDGNIKLSDKTVDEKILEVLTKLDTTNMTTNEILEEINKDGDNIFAGQAQLKEAIFNDLAYLMSDKHVSQADRIRANQKDNSKFILNEFLSNLQKGVEEDSAGKKKKVSLSDTAFQLGAQTADFITSLPGLITGLFVSVSSFLANNMGVLKRAFNAMGDVAAKIGGFLIDVAKSIGRFFVSAYEGLKNWLSKTTDDAVGWFRDKAKSLFGWGDEAAEEVAEKTTKNVAGEVVEEVAEKTESKLLSKGGKFAAKKVPGIGASFLAADIAEDLRQDDTTGMAFNTLSAAASNIPVYGTVASVVIDGVNVGREWWNGEYDDPNFSYYRSVMEDYDGKVINNKNKSPLDQRKIDKLNAQWILSTVDHRKISPEVLRKLKAEAQWDPSKMKDILYANMYSSTQGGRTTQQAPSQPIVNNTTTNNTSNTYINNVPTDLSLYQALTLSKF